MVLKGLNVQITMNAQDWGLACTKEWKFNPKSKDAKKISWPQITACQAKINTTLNKKNWAMET